VEGVCVGKTGMVWKGSVCEVQRWYDDVDHVTGYLV
jgi:hypothetical protein